MPNYGGFRTDQAGCQFAEVEVDVETGVVRVLRVVAVHDAGRIINPLTARSQVNGGVIMGVGFALMEERRLDPQLGLMVNPTMDDYKLPGPLDVPEITAIFVEVANGLSNTGVLGFGEAAHVATTAAIACAVYDAIGVPVRALCRSRRTRCSAHWKKPDESLRNNRNAGFESGVQAARRALSRRDCRRRRSARSAEAARSRSPQPGQSQSARGYRRDQIRRQGRSSGGRPGEDASGGDGSSNRHALHRVVAGGGGSGHAADSQSRDGRRQSPAKAAMLVLSQSRRRLPQERWRHLLRR